MSPTAAWLAAAERPDAEPLFIFRLPQQGLYFASDPGHYPDDRGGEPHHAGMIDKGGLPVMTRKIQNIFSGRSVTTLGSLKLIDTGAWDGYFGDHNATIRGAALHGFVTYPGLAWSDAQFYLSARVTRITATQSSQLTVSLIDDAAPLQSPLVDAATYSGLLGDLVKTRLTTAGLVWPDNFDHGAWAAWTAPGKPGSFTVSGSWQDGDVMSVIDHLLRETLSWYRFSRDGLFVIEQFSDSAGTPPSFIDLTNRNALFEGGRTTFFEPVMRQQTVKYNDGVAQSVVKTVNLSPTHPWWASAQEGKPKDPGLTLPQDASALCAARLALLSRERLVTDIRTDSRMLGFELGDIVKINFGDNRLPTIAQQFHRVIAIKENPNEGETTLTLWTDMGGPPLL